jgi:hypothetical protein
MEFCSILHAVGVLHQKSGLGWFPAEAQWNRLARALELIPAVRHWKAERRDPLKGRREESCLEAEEVQQVRRRQDLA